MRKITLYDISWDCPTDHSDFDSLPQTVDFTEDYPYVDPYDFSPDLAMKILSARYGWTISDIDFVFDE